MGDTSQGRLAFVKEAVPGVPPANPAWRVLDFVDEDLVQSSTQVRSAAVTAQRVVRGSRRASKEVGNGFRFELYSGAEVDMLLASLLGNPFTGTPPQAVAGGAVADTFTFERRLSATDYRRFSGFQVGQAEFTLQPEQHVMCRMTGVGYTMTTGKTELAGSAYTAATAGEKLTALDVANIGLSGIEGAAFDFNTLSFTVNNQLATRKRLGPATVRGIGKGQVLVTGTASIFVPDSRFADAYNAETKFDMATSIIYAAAGYGFKFGNCAITEYNDNNTGNGEEFMGTVGFEATLDPDLNSSFAIQRIVP